MKEYWKVVRKRFLLTLLLNPACLLVYTAMCKNLSMIWANGMSRGNTQSLVSCGIFICYWSAIYLMMINKKSRVLPQEVVDNYIVDKNGVTIYGKNRVDIDYCDIWNYMIIKKYIYTTMKNGDILLLNISNKEQGEAKDISDYLKRNTIDNSRIQLIWNILAVLFIVFITIFYIIK